MVKNNLIILTILFFSCVSLNCKATTLENLPPISAAATSPVMPQPVNFKGCNRFFKLDSDKLFYITLAAVNANRFTLDEIQSKSGYIMFSAGNRQYLASVLKVDSKNSMLRITPCDNYYYFPIGIIQNMFKYIELNINTPIEILSVS